MLFPTRQQHPIGGGEKSNTVEQPLLRNFPVAGAGASGDVNKVLAGLAHNRGTRSIGYDVATKRR